MKPITCIVETPKGSGCKINFEPALGCYKLGKTLPAGLVFPFDFGYIPGTVGEDGDPLDVIIISEIKSFPGCALECRVIGALEAHQTELNGERVRNDRYLAIPEISVLHQQVTQLGQLPRQIIEEIEAFFVNYNEQAGKRFEPLEKRSAAEAQKAIQEAQSVAAPTHLIQLLLPLSDEEGKPFPPKHYTAIQEKLTEKFGGATLYTRSPAAGLWKDEDNHVVKDQVVVFEVMTSAIDKAFWRSYRQGLEKTFAQDQIIIRRIEMGLL